MKTKTGHSKSDLSKELEVIVAFLQQPKAKRSFVDAMNAAFFLWENYDVDVKEIVVRVLEKVVSIPGGSERLKKEFKDTTERRRLLHDPRLKDIAPEISPPRHRWPLLAEPFFLSKQDDAKQQEWLDAWELVDNPFGNSNLTIDPFTMKTIVNPCQWEEYINRKPRIFSTIEFHDRQVVIRNICKEFSNFVDDDTFVITKTLPFSELTKDSSRYDYLASLAKLVGKQWFDYLTDLYEDDKSVIICPTDFLDLEKEYQDELATFLAWMCGSNEQLLVLLRERGLREYKNGRKLLEVMERILKIKTDLPNPVPEKQLFSWLQLHPPGRSSILLLINFPEQDEEKMAERQAWNLMQLANLLIEKKIFLKLFSNDQFLPPKPLQIIPLQWEEVDLKSMLSSRLQSVSTGIRSIDEFFGPIRPADPVQSVCEDRFLHKAKGSLAALLRYCNQLLDHHLSHKFSVDNLQETMYFEEQDIDIIIENNQ